MRRAIDYSTWIPKQQASEALGLTTRTLEKMAGRGEIQARRWKRPTTGAQIVVYNPADINRLRKEYMPEAGEYVMPAPDPADAFPARSGALALRPREDFQLLLRALAESSRLQADALAQALNQNAEALRAVAAAAAEKAEADKADRDRADRDKAAAAESARTAARENQVALAQRLFLTLREASEYTGLSVRTLQSFIAGQRILCLRSAGRGGTHVVARRDLDRLCGVSDVAQNAGRP